MSAQQWDALCVWAAGWCDLGPERMEGSAPREWEAAMRFFSDRMIEGHRTRRTDPLLYEFAGLALFGRLMALALDPVPLKRHAEGKASWEAANVKGTFPAWEDLSEASRAYWVHPKGPMRTAERRRRIAQWNGLAHRAAGWVGADVHGYLSADDLRAFARGTVSHGPEYEGALGGIGLFAKLMAIAMGGST